MVVCGEVVVEGAGKAWGEMGNMGGMGYPGIAGKTGIAVKRPRKPT